MSGRVWSSEIRTVVHWRSVIVRLVLGGVLALVLHWLTAFLFPWNLVGCALLGYACGVIGQRQWPACHYEWTEYGFPWGEQGHVVRRYP